MHGLPGDGRVQDSNGPTPFGFAFGKRDQLFVSEAFGGAENASATSSYDIDRQGVLTTISASVGTNQTADCWVVVTPNGRFAYVTNTGSGSISGYAIDFDGSIELLDADGRTARHRRRQCTDRPRRHRQRTLPVQLEQRHEHDRRVSRALRRVSRAAPVHGRLAIRSERARGSVILKL